MLKTWLLKLLNLLLGQDKEQIEPTIRATIGIGELWELLKARFPTADIYLADEVYQLCSPEDIATFLAQDNTNKMGFVDELRDCDDFAYRLMGQLSVPKWSGLAVGICWTENHAFNCFLDNNKKLWFIEPQSDAVLEDLIVWQGTTIRFLVM